MKLVLFVMMTSCLVNTIALAYLIFSLIPYHTTFISYPL